jgi:hypothetical protein
MISVSVVQFLLLILQLIQAVINSPLCQQILVSALFPQASFVEYQNAVGVLNSAQAVGNRQRGSSRQQAVQRFTNLQFRFGVNARGRLVQNQEPRIVRQRSRKTN